MNINFYTSYFYQIRNFSKNKIPLSTAKWDPIWYHANTRNNNFAFVDKRSIVNGLKFNLFIPNDFEKEAFKKNIDFKPCNKNCKMTINNCDFMREYRNQLSNIKFEDFEKEIKNILNKEIVLNNAIKEAIYNFENNLNICFIVFESPNNPCSERIHIQEFFFKNDKDIKEWNKNNI